MSRPPNSLPLSLGASFKNADARALGVHHRRLRQPDVARLLRGVYARTDYMHLNVREDAHAQEIWRCRQRDLARTLAAQLSPELFFARRTAAALWDLPVSGSEAQVDIASFLAGQRLRRPEVNFVRVLPRMAAVVENDGVRLTDPATTWAMLAPQLGRDGAVALGDAVVRDRRIPGTARFERPPLATLDELLRVANEARRPGAPFLRGIVPLLSTRSASPPESHLRLRLREWGTPEPHLDFDVYDPDGQLVGCSEFAYPEFKLSLEYEGDHHRTEARQWHRDIEKYRCYEQLGWEVIRVTSSLLYVRQRELRDQVFEALRRRGWRC